MADFNSVVLTERGIALMTKAIAGECTTEFTKIQSGDGVWSTSLSRATSLKNVRQEFGVSRAYVVNESTVAVLGVLSNLNLSEGYYVREYGIFACEEGKESSTEVLYAIVTASEPDYMPPYNSVQPQTMELETYLAVANASNVTIKTGTGALASAEDLQKHLDSKVTDESGTHGLRYFKNRLQVEDGKGGWTGASAENEQLEQNVTALMVAVTLLKGSAINGTSGNVIVETFDDANSYVIVSGQYDKTNKRLYA